MPEKITITFTDKDPKRHSIRWNAEDKDAIVDAIYIRKPAFQNARKIRLTVEEVTD